MMPILPAEGWQRPEASSHDPKVPEKDGRHETGKVLPLRPTTTLRLCVSPAALPNPLRVQDRVCTLRECSTSVGQVTKNQSFCSQLMGDIRETLASDTMLQDWPCYHKQAVCSQFGFRVFVVVVVLGGGGGLEIVYLNEIANPLGQGSKLKR